MFDRKLIIDRLRFENPWWETGKIDAFYRLLKPRLYFPQFYGLLQVKTINRSIVLMGPRRVGKTVLLFHVVQKLLDEEINRRKICYISIETPIYNKIGLEELFQMTREASLELNPDNWIVIFDEIQYLKDWEIHLKSLSDSYKRTKFIVSGSAAAALKLKSNESGAGRFTDFMLPPLTFNEFLFLKGDSNLVVPSQIQWEGSSQPFFKSINIQKLNKIFLDYINFGGYPEVVFSTDIQSDPGRYLRNDIIDKVLLRDLPSLYGIQDVQELNSLFTAIAFNSGSEFSFEELSRKLGLDKITVKKYISYLEAAFLIKMVKRVDNSSKIFSRQTSFKIYLTNPSIRCALFSPLDMNDQHLGLMVETAIYSQWLQRDWIKPYYAKWKKGEVDMVGLDEKSLKPVWAVEIKWSNRFFEKPSELKSLTDFCKTNNLKSAIVTTIDKEGEHEFDGIKFHFVPAAIYTYVVAKNTIDNKQKR